MKIVQIARICHQANKALCENLGDFSQSDWSSAPDWQTKSAIKGVRFHLDNPGAGPEASHESWLKEKKEQGWKYGPVKNPEKKEHPCIVTFDELPKEQQAKDYLFKSIVDELRIFIE